MSFGKQTAAAGVAPGRVTDGPPAVMCLTACAIVLLLGGYRSSSDSLPESQFFVNQASAGEPSGLEWPGDEAIYTDVALADLDFDPLAEASFTHTAEPARELLEARVERDTETYLHEVGHRVRRGDTLSRLLYDAGVPEAEVNEWVRAAQQVYDLDHIYAGQGLALQIDSRSRQLQQLELAINRTDVLIAHRGLGGVSVRREALQYETRTQVAEGTIGTSLYSAAVERGVPESVVSQIAEILGWEIDFSRDLSPRATFRVVYEQLVPRGSMPTIAGHVLAVECVNQGRRHEAFFFADGTDHDEGYYDREGHALGRRFLRYPVDYSRISSGFSESRFHPILKYARPHYGVDFAAPVGTPVRAIAGGRVARAGWSGGSGRFVKLLHDAVYASGYAHLSRIADGISPGSHVEKGQVIGYVGATGLATGPHLHFALYEAGRYVDPLSAKLPQARSLEGGQLAAFRGEIMRLEAVYAAAEEEPRTPIVTASAR